MTATAAFAVETAPIIPLIPVETKTVVAETPPLEAVKKEPLHWSELAYWKAYPDRKPLDPKRVRWRASVKRIF